MHIKCSLSALVSIAILLTVTVESAVPPFPPFANTENLKFVVEKRITPEKKSDVLLDYRLPNETYPVHYNIKLTTNAHSGEKPFQGEVVIDIVVEKATNKIVLHARQITITKVSATNPSTGEKDELSYEYETEREFLTLLRNNEKQFVAGSNWQLTLIYNGTLRDDNRGFYINKYVAESGEDRYFASTQFESTEARHAFPCYDEPNKRANFTITLIHSPAYKAISNMPINAALSSSGKTTFLTTPSLPTYVLAFIVSDFEYTEGTLNSLPQRVYSRGAVKNTQEWALVSSMLITRSLSKYFGVDLMLSKLDHVAVPDFGAGGMENWGLATYGEGYLLYNENSSTTFKRHDVANILGHEIAHQWFGDLVTMKWWTYLWLKEGFATLFSYRALADAYPEWDIWQDFHIGPYKAALSNDAKENPRPMTHYVQTPSEITTLYDAVSYSKAATVLSMWSNALTDKVFQRGLYNYLTVNQYTAAVEEQLFTAIQNAAKEENYKIPATIEKMMGSWTNQGGHPLLTVTRNYENGTFTVKQEAFQNNATLEDPKTWYVPLNFAVASKPDFRNTEATHYLLNVTEMEINAGTDKNEWLLLNKQSAFYYRIKYDTENYNLIIDSLIQRPFNFHPRNRAQLMDDAFTLSVTSQRIDHSVLLKMMSYLAKEDQYAPWTIASDIIKIFHKYLSVHENYDDLKFFVSDIISPIYQRLGVNDIPGEQLNQKHTRHEIINLACMVGLEDCLLETNNKLKSLINDNTAIEPNLKNEIYCNGLRQSSDEEFEFFFNQLMNSTDKNYRFMLISSLGCSQNENHMKKFMFSSIDYTNNLRESERDSILNSVYSRSEMGLLTCIEFLNENWSKFSDLEFDMYMMSSYVVNKNQQEKYLALFAKLKEQSESMASQEDEVNSRMNENFEWLKNNQNPLMTWLAQYHADKLHDGSASLVASAVLIAVSFMATVMNLL